MYWTIRAEADDDADEAGASGAPGMLIHVYHYHADAQNHVRAGAASRPDTRVVVKRGKPVRGAVCSSVSVLTTGMQITWMQITMSRKSAQSLGDMKHEVHLAQPQLTVTGEAALPCCLFNSD